MLRPGTVINAGGGDLWVVESASDRRDCYFCWIRYHHGSRKFYFRNDQPNKRLKLMSEHDVSIADPTDFVSDFWQKVVEILG